MDTLRKANVLGTISPQAGKTLSHLLGALAAISFVLLILSARIRPAAAMEDCILHDVALQQLSRAYNEQVTGPGLTADGQKMIELLASEGGSWTLIITDVHGNTCMLASGEVSITSQRPASALRNRTLGLPSGARHERHFEDNLPTRGPMPIPRTS